MRERFLFVTLVMATGCGSSADGTATPHDGGATGLAQTLFVAHEGFLSSYDIATGNERAGTIPNVTGPVDMQALPDGHLFVNLTGRNEVLIFDGKTMLETARLPSSSKGATRPVHSYLSPDVAGKRYWISLNDGDGNKPTNSAQFVDVTPGSAKYLQVAGEVALGVGHHKAAFSTTQARVVISNISDCDDVLTVYDFSDVAQIKSLATLTAKAAGWDGSSFGRTCDPSYKMGVPAAPHGCASSKVSKKVYCNLTGAGDIVVVDIDAPTPTFKSLKTTGSGAGYTKASPDGRFLYALQASPREGDKVTGAACQVGQLVVIEAQNDAIAKQLPLLYKGPACADMLAKTPAETDEPGHIRVSPDGKTLFIAIDGGFNVADARSNQEVVVDVSDPPNAVQKPSITIGQGGGHHGDAVSGDGKFLFVTNNEEGSVSQIAIAAGTVVKTIKTKDKPLTVATWGAAEGPSEATGPIH